MFLRMGDTLIPLRWNSFPDIGSNFRARPYLRRTCERNGYRIPPLVHGILANAPRLIFDAHRSTMCKKRAAADSVLRENYPSIAKLYPETSFLAGTKVE